MNIPFILKFSNITNLSDARYAAGVWAHYVGFCFNPESENYIEPNKAKEMLSWINGPIVVAEFGNQPIEWIIEICEFLNTDYIQIPVNYNHPSILEIDKKLIVETDGEQNELTKNAHLIVTNSIVSYSKLKENITCPIILSKNYEENINNYDGIIFYGEKETEVGLRNHEKWNNMLAPFMDAN